MSLVSNCVKCGAPIYTPTIWHAMMPPFFSFCHCQEIPRAGQSFYKTTSKKWIRKNKRYTK